MIADEITEEPEPESPKHLEVSLANPNGYPETRARALRPWVEALLGELAPEADSFAVRFVGDRAMRRMNRDFRGRDRTTDVLSFPGGGTPEGMHLGDVLISVPTARRQAGEEPGAAVREIKVLLLHGVLHCLGFDHETDDGEMERMEKKLRRRWVGKA